MLSSVVTTSKGLVIITTEKLSGSQRKNISVLVTGHLETLVERIQKNKPGKLNIIKYFIFAHLDGVRWLGQTVDHELCPEEGC